MKSSKEGMKKEPEIEMMMGEEEMNVIGTEIVKDIEIMDTTEVEKGINIADEKMIRDSWFMGKCY